MIPLETLIILYLVFGCFFAALYMVVTATDLSSVEAIIFAVGWIVIALILLFTAGMYLLLENLKKGKT